MYCQLNLLVQRGRNKQPISNQRDVYAVFLLTFDFRLSVLGIFDWLQERLHDSM